MTTPSDPFGSPAGDPASGQPPPGWGQPPGQPGWGAPPGGPGGYGASGPRKNGLGVAALVVGILALLTSFTVVVGAVLGIVALVLGLVGRGRAKRGEADNGGVALTGAVLGGVALLLSIVIAATIGAVIFGSESGRNLVECLADAGDDQAAVEQCEREFEGSVTP
ncbi:MAG TPA: DUF4190 domain-containing protein [Mycobacteriales bacterium]|nr:DUF4190 domain-containing protein [Mycobacteriales bacterium]